MFCQADKIFLVEFKNQKQSNIEKQEIVQKFEDSVTLLKRLFQENNIAFKNYIINLYLVIKDGNNYQTYKNRQKEAKLSMLLKHEIL